MKKKKQEIGFFEETIDLSPSNNIQTSAPTDFPQIEKPQLDYGMSERINEQRAKHRFKENLKQNATKIILISLCVYMVFLIFGALKTNYFVDETTGTRQPIFVTYKDVADKKDYNALKKQMTQLREILIEIRITEIKYNNKDITQTEAATNYNNILKKVDIIIPKLSALNVGDNQKSIQTAMTTCYSVHLAGYLQEMYKGLSTNNEAAIQTALTHRENMFKSYFAAQDSLKELGEKLRLSDEYFDWDLDKEVAKKDPTAILKEKE